MKKNGEGWWVVIIGNDSPPPPPPFNKKKSHDLSQYLSHVFFRYKSSFRIDFEENKKNNRSSAFVIKYRFQD
ncbi:hypothetical protein Phum_PHUM112050 [Pediculus humanus corporis]|uniref:Uncharacterized protein n=1 Tax=Pediculus humanus subsp. corporis TaxID=121224 RepID=E0VDD2_PEDHC|nr:uncharacterized protein Phum_PHUM112050 [Pediculus humanus corporis]EEB11388.1 hypothetical protein Phum_PHUM112050 [Pediculus humanus corporis]